jgi:hypothetical protein
MVLTLDNHEKDCLLFPHLQIIVELERKPDLRLRALLDIYRIGQRLYFGLVEHDHGLLVEKLSRFRHQCAQGAFASIPSAHLRPDPVTRVIKGTCIRWASIHQANHAELEPISLQRLRLQILWP